MAAEAGRRKVGRQLLAARARAEVGAQRHALAAAVEAAQLGDHLVERRLIARGDATRAPFATSPVAIILPIPRPPPVVARACPRRRRGWRSGGANRRRAVARASQSRGEVSDGRWTGGVCRRRLHHHHRQPCFSSALRAQRYSLLSSPAAAPNAAPSEFERCVLHFLSVGDWGGCRSAVLTRPDRGGRTMGKIAAKIRSICAGRRRSFLLFGVSSVGDAGSAVRTPRRARSGGEILFGGPGHHDYDGNATVQLLYPKKHWHFPSAQYSWRETLEDDGRTTVDFVMLDTILLCGPDSAVDRKVKGAEKAWRWVEAALAGSTPATSSSAATTPSGRRRRTGRRASCPSAAAAADRRQGLGLLFRPRPLPVPRRRGAHSSTASAPASPPRTRRRTGIGSRPTSRSSSTGAAA